MSLIKRSTAFVVRARYEDLTHAARWQLRSDLAVFGRYLKLYGPGVHPLSITARSAMWSACVKDQWYSESMKSNRHVQTMRREQRAARGRDGVGRRPQRQFTYTDHRYSDVG